MLLFFHLCDQFGDDCLADVQCVVMFQHVPGYFITRDHQELQCLEGTCLEFTGAFGQTTTQSHNSITNFHRELQWILWCECERSYDLQRQTRNDKVKG